MRNTLKRIKDFIVDTFFPYEYCGVLRARPKRYNLRQLYALREEAVDAWYKAKYIKDAQEDLQELKKLVGWLDKKIEIVENIHRLEEQEYNDLVLQIPFSNYPRYPCTPKPKRHLE